MRTSSLLRERGRQDSNRVAMVELFFDLVFVFAVTQLSHALLDNLSVRGALQTLLLFLAVWWLWIFTSWVTNWLDPGPRTGASDVVRLMLGGLLLSSSIPQAFGERGLVFGVRVRGDAGRPFRCSCSLRRVATAKSFAATSSALRFGCRYRARSGSSAA